MVKYENIHKNLGKLTVYFKGKSLETDALFCEKSLEMGTFLRKLHLEMGVVFPGWFYVASGRRPNQI